MFIDDEGSKPRPDHEFSLAVLAVCKQLASEQAHILWRLLILLNKVQENSEITKMNSENLGKIFAPTVCDTHSEDAAKALKNNHLASNIMTLMIEKAPLLSDCLRSLQSSKCWRMLGYPAPVNEKEQNLFKLHSTGKSYGKGQPIIQNGTGSKSCYYKFVFLTFFFLHFFPFINFNF